MRSDRLILSGFLLLSASVSLSHAAPRKAAKGPQTKASAVAKPVRWLVQPQTHAEVRLMQLQRMHPEATHMYLPQEAPFPHIALPLSEVADFYWVDDHQGGSWIITMKDGSSPEDRVTSIAIGRPNQKATPVRPDTMIMRRAPVTAADEMSVRLAAIKSMLRGANVLMGSNFMGQNERDTFLLHHIANISAGRWSSGGHFFTLELKSGRDVTTSYLRALSADDPDRAVELDPSKDEVWWPGNAKLGEGKLPSPHAQTVAMLKALHKIMPDADRLITQDHGMVPLGLVVGMKGAPDGSVSVRLRSGERWTDSWARLGSAKDAKRELRDAASSLDFMPPEK